MKKYLILFLIFILFECNSAIVSANTMPRISKDVLSDIQTFYIESDVKSTMSAVIAVLYDSDYSIEDYNEELGIIRAKKMLKASYTNKKRVAGWSAVLAAASAYTVFSYGSTAASMYSPTRRIATELKDKTVIIDANIFIEQISQNTVKLRFIPVEKVLQNADGFAFNQAAPIKIIRIYKAAPYQEFFNQVKGNIECIKM